MAPLTRHLLGGRTDKATQFDFTEQLWCWNDIIQSYSAMELTYPTDKLVAIGGLAARAREHIGGRYIAGMWERVIILQLLWSLFKESQPSHGSGYFHGPRPYTAPSWPWASVDSELIINNRVSLKGYIEVAEVVSYDVQLLDYSNPYGRVLPGTSLLLRGSLSRLKHAARCPFYLDTESNMTRVSKRSISWDSDADRVNNDVEYIALPLLCKPQLGDKWNLPPAKNEPYSWLTVEGLALEAAQEKGSFQRRGFFWLMNDFGIQYTALSQSFAKFDEDAGKSGLNYTNDGILGYSYTIKLV